MTWVGSQSSLRYAAKINLHIKSLAEVRNLKPYLWRPVQVEPIVWESKEAPLGEVWGRSAACLGGVGLSWACHFFPQTHQSGNWRFFPWGDTGKGSWGWMLPYSKFYHMEVWGEWGVSVPCYHLTLDTLLCTLAWQKGSASDLWLVYYLVKLACAEFLSRSWKRRHLCIYRIFTTKHLSYLSTEIHK